MTTDEHGRIEPEGVAGEADTLVAFLEFHRDTLRWKTDGLDDAQLRQSMQPSQMTLGGVLVHLAVVEDWWFNRVFLGRAWSAPFRGVDWDADVDWDWHVAGTWDADRVRATWQEAVAASRAVVAEAVTGGDPGQLSAEGRHTLRWILVHMVEEYARHNGHVDLMRERLDGLTGE